MLVTAEAVLGSVGGGNLEWQAIEKSRAMLKADEGQGRQEGCVEQAEWALGPGLGQCCGGRVRLSFERLSRRSGGVRLRQVLEEPHVHLAVFGAGHVGMALSSALAPLPFLVTMVDSRAEALQPLAVQANLSDGRLQLDHEDQPHSAVPSLPSGAGVLVMTHSHAQDFDIVLACLERQRSQGDLPWLGLIGSRSKWRGFASRLRERGFGPDLLNQVQCPVGLTSQIQGKAPAVIAASVTAQLLSLHPSHAVAL